MTYNTMINHQHWSWPIDGLRENNIQQTYAHSIDFPLVLGGMSVKSSEISTPLEVDNSHGHKWSHFTPNPVAPSLGKDESYRCLVKQMRENRRGTDKACNRCRQKKVGCESGRPCRRCKSAGVVCTDSDPLRCSSIQASSMQEAQDFTRFKRELNSLFQRVQGIEAWIRANMQLWPGSTTGAIESYGAQTHRTYAPNGEAALP